MRDTTWLCTVALLAVVAGCDVAPSPQSMRGTLGAGWDSPPVELWADARGRRIVAPIAPDGSFAVEVPGQRRYAFALLQADGTTVGMVFPRSPVSASDALRVYGGASTFDLGAVGRVAPFEPDVFSTTTMRPSMQDIGASRQALIVTGTPADGAANAAPSDDDDDGGDDGTETCDEDFDSDSDSDDDDDSDADEDDATLLVLDEAAVPSNVPPSGLGRCDDDSSDSESDDDDEHDDDEDEDDDD